jgi:hypothetical protein
MKQFFTRIIKLQFLILLTFLSNNVDAQVTACAGFTTYTQGGWGSNPKGNNPGTILESNFKNVFPFGLTIGSINKISFNSASAVRAFLPQGGTPKRLNPGTSINPTKSNFSSVLAGQLVAATINVQFDKNLTNFGSSSTHLKDLKIAIAPFFNFTIEEVIAEANSFIGGKISNYTANDFNTILTRINEGYDNGTTSNSIFACPIVFNTTTTDVKCVGESNGTLSVSGIVGGAGAPYTFKLNGVNVYLPLNTLSVGVYTLEVFDKLGLSAKKQILINEPVLLSINTNVGAISCYGGSTNVTISASGGKAPYTGTGVFNKTAGNYTFTVSDANGCVASADINITEPSLLTIRATPGVILCNGDSTEVSVQATGGTAPYTGTGVFNKTAGNYTFTVSDANGCVASTNLNISEPAILTLYGTSAEDSSCNTGITTGKATITANGGTSPYTYTWSNGTTGTNIITNIPFNTVLNVTVSDANGCSSTFNFDTIRCDKQIVEVVCNALKTFTQGGWGAVPNGNNPGVYLHANFSTVFPSGLTIGNVTNNIKLTTATDVTNFLPSGGSLNTLTGANVNPAGTIKSTIAGQLVAATLNVGFDSYDANFGNGTNILADMYCNFSRFYGVKVSDLLTEANQRIAGATTTHSSSALNNALTKLNENYDNGNQDNGDFVCTNSEADLNLVQSTESNIVSNTLSIYPNPASDLLNIDVISNRNEVATINIYNTTGQLIASELKEVTEGANLIKLNLSALNLQYNTILVELILNNTTQRKVIIIQ